MAEILGYRLYLNPTSITSTNLLITDLLVGLRTRSDKWDINLEVSSNIQVVYIFIDITKYRIFLSGKKDYENFKDSIYEVIEDHSAFLDIIKKHYYE